MALHAPTLLLTAAMISILLTVLQVMAAWRLQSRALLYWAAANAALGGGCALLGVRAVIPLWLSAVVGNGLVMAGLALIMSGIRCFDGMRPRTLVFIALAVAATAALAVSLASGDRLGERVTIVSAFTAGWALLACLALLRTTRHAPALSRGLSASVLLLLSAAYALRAAAVQSGLVTQEAALTGPLLSWILLFGLAIGIVWSFSSLFMVLDRLASMDDLTGLFNRRTALLRGRQQLDEAAARKIPLSVLLVDIDHFKSINDRFGHSVGDDVLRAFARIAQTSVRGTDFIGRYGGEEFCIILPNTDLNAAREVAERLRRLTQSELGRIDGHDINTTVSVGVATFRPGEPRYDTIFTLINSADAALYCAKAGGRNRVVGDGPADGDAAAPGMDTAVAPPAAG